MKNNNLFIEIRSSVGRWTLGRTSKNLNLLRETSAGFFVQARSGERIPLNQIQRVADSSFFASSADDFRRVSFEVKALETYITFRLTEAAGFAPGDPLRLELHVDEDVRATELDYMTDVKHSENGFSVVWDGLTGRGEADPMGGFALYVREDDDDEDEILTNLWVQEGLAHPAVDGDWTVERARAWVAEWCSLYADRSQMILAGQSLEELYAALPYAKKAQIKEIYLFTDTWRTDNFWPGCHGNVHINRKVFPRGEADLIEFGKAVAERGMRLNVHYVSGGIGFEDPTYVGESPDRRLASWGRGILAESADAESTELVVRFEPGTQCPPVLEHFFEYTLVRIEDEIIRVGEFVQQGVIWLLRACERGQFTTAAAEHKQGAETIGLVSAYGSNFIPENSSSLLDEIAAGFAGMVNRCRMGHTEYDGAEIHRYNGRWGYRKFATLVYEKLDHPVTAHDSSGYAPSPYFEYRLNCCRRLLRGTNPCTHGNWSASVQPASASRPASTLLDAHFLLSQGHLGGAMGLAKPEPMFGVSAAMLKQHGLTDQLIDVLLSWKKAIRLLNDEQRAMIDRSFTGAPGRMPEYSRHPASEIVWTVRCAQDAYELVPVRVLRRTYRDILWQHGQEHGALSPRQFVKPGESVVLQNPDREQTPHFILKILWGFDAQRTAKPVPRGSGGPGLFSGEAEFFVAGNHEPFKTAGPDEPNLLLQPAKAELSIPDGGHIETVVEEVAGDVLRLRAENPDGQERWETTRLPEWKISADLRAHRGIGLRVTGDGSGAILLIQIPGRDYIVPIDFVGSRTIEIPNGEVAWADVRWGWRMETKCTRYGQVDRVRIGFGYLPANSRAEVTVENLMALTEISAELKQPVIRAGNGSLTVDGPVASGELLVYEGGGSATVYSPDWHPLRTLPVRAENFLVPQGDVQFSIEAQSGRVSPWLEIQVLTEGEASALRDR